MAGPSQDFWQQRFETGQTPWDRGAPHPQLKRWLADGTLPADAQVLVPGCGSGHELVALARAGVAATGLDYAPAAVALARERLGRWAVESGAEPDAGADAVASRPAVGVGVGVGVGVQQADVLQWQPPAPVDLVYEQTCLCALHPDHWQRYAAQLHGWLRPGGRLLALFMQARREASEQGQIIGPPYHGDIHAMRALFPAALWDWPAPPYAQQPHEQGWFELAVVLVRR